MQRPDPNGPNGFFGLPSTWSHASSPMENGIAGRFEGEVADLVVYGEIPKEIDGTFYRIMVDPFYPLQEGNPPIEGDGNICAFRIQDGRVDMKVRYVDTERLRLERQANKRLFGLYRNPFSHHPCVRAAVDSTANTNLVYWAGKLLALKESALPYAVDPDTLETICYDPFHSPGKTFSAHPKVDPYTNELVVFGYEAKGLGTSDIVIYAIDQAGNIHDEQWIQSPPGWTAFIHDCAITPNFIILILWPYDADVDKMKNPGAQHWTYNRDRPATFIVAPRRPSNPPAGWSPGESSRTYYASEHAILLHTAGAWEEATDPATGGSPKILLEASRMKYNIFLSLDPSITPQTPNPFGDNLQADYVRWELDLSQPSNSALPPSAATVILDMPCEMARIDERFLTRTYTKIFCPVILPPPTPSPGAATQGQFPAIPLPPILPVGINGYLLLDKSKSNPAAEAQTNKASVFNPGPNATLEEPIFIPRSATNGQVVQEGDGYLLGMIHRLDVNRSDLVVLDTNDFSTPLAVVQLPFRTKRQIHGNWVGSEQRGEDGQGEGKKEGSLVRRYEGCVVSGRGALEVE